MEGVKVNLHNPERIQLCRSSIGSQLVASWKQMSWYEVTFMLQAELVTWIFSKGITFHWTYKGRDLFLGRRSGHDI